MRSRLALACLVALLFVGPGPGAAQPAPSLAGPLRALITDANLGDRIGVVVVDATTGEPLFDHRGDLLLNPASNMKLVTAAAALLRLGPEHQMRTALLGRIEGTRVSKLVLQGYGDPTLRMSDLVELAESLADRGVRSVGEVVVDGSFFDDQVLPPAYDQQPDEMADFRAPVGAVSVEHSTWVLRALPGAEPGARADVRLRAAGYFELDNQLSTDESDEPHVVVVQRGDGPVMQLAVRGTIPAGSPGVGYRRRVNNPLSYAGHALVDALAHAGIRASGRVRVAAEADGLPLLAARLSPPLSQVLYDMGKDSDNFVAEMVLKQLGAARRQPGTTEAGAEVLREVLGEAGAEVEGAEIINGSGLFVGNKIAARQLAALLSYMYRDPSVRSEYVSQLSIGGVDGTLHRRMRDLPEPRAVRAKTGTLNDVIALSGYVLGPRPDRVWAFSVLCNGIRGKQHAARQLGDAIATELVRQMWATPR